MDTVRSLLHLSPDAPNAEAARALGARLTQLERQRDAARRAEARSRLDERMHGLLRAAEAEGISPATPPTSPAAVSRPARVARPRPWTREAWPRVQWDRLPWTTLGSIAAGALILCGAFWWLSRPPTHTHDTTRLRFVAAPALGGAYVGEVEVSVAAFAAFVERTGHVTDAERRGQCYTHRPGSTPYWSAASWRTVFQGKPAHLPVACVSWNDARAFAAWLSRTDPTGTYRLPTSAEWFDLAKGEGEAYGFGADARLLRRYGNVAGQEAGFTWASEALYADTHPAVAPSRSFRASRPGVYDLHGNLWEWVLDAHPKPQHRVIRGGGWTSRARGATTGAYNGSPQHVAANDIGFRLLYLPS